METFVGIGDENIDKITHLNAMAHYRFSPFATRTKDQCRAGALRAQATDVDTVTRVGRLAGARDRDAWRQLVARSTTVNEIAE